MKKGFTLIELLAVIVILAIILVIAVPRILKIIDSSKVNSYISNKKLVLKSAELYVSKNIENLPVNIGDTAEILLSTLITEGYIKNIKSPFSNSNCSGYILITKTAVDLYDYIPHINCIDNTRVSATTDGLVGYWKLNGNAIDYSMRNNHGTAAGVTVVNGMKDKAYSFDGTTSSITLNNAPLGDTLTDFTIALWTKGTPRLAEFSYIIHRSSANSVSGSVYYIGTTNEGFIGFGISGNWASTTTAILQDPNTWYHIVLKYKSGVIEGFVNGISKVTATIGIGVTVAGTKPTIGDSTVTNPGRKYNGIISDVLIYNRGLSSEEIRILYESTK